MTIWLAVVITALCLLVEAFFSGSEMALVSVNRALLRQRAADGDRAARLVEEFLAAPQLLFTTTLLGTNVSVVVASSVVTLTALAHAPDLGEVFAVAVLSPAILIFGETVPKTLFQQHADRLAPKIIYPLRVAAFVFHPVAIVFGRIVSLAARLLQVEERRALVTRDELRLLLEPSGGEPAAIPEGERTMISNVLEFSETTVYDVMVPLSEVAALSEDATLEEAAAEVADKQHTRIPVYRERVDQIVGFIHAFDILRAQAAGRSGAVAELARRPLFVPESRPAVDLLVELKRGRQQLAVVVNEYGGATGICTVEDILEEIVGEIEDEYDEAPPAIAAEAPGVWRVAARTPIDRVNEALKIELPEGEDFETVAGFVLDRLKRIPREGEALRCGNALLTVVAVSERAIEEVRIRVDRRRM
ncbi:MAG: hemolysin family protein [Pseudomonadota bacterium]